MADGEAPFAPLDPAGEGFVLLDGWRVGARPRQR